MRLYDFEPLTFGKVYYTTLCILVSFIESYYIVRTFTTKALNPLIIILKEGSDVVYLYRALFPNVLFNLMWPKKKFMVFFQNLGLLQFESIFFIPQGFFRFLRDSLEILKELL